MTRRLRVLFYIGSMHAGGAERQVVEILRHLDRQRFDPLLALASREGSLLAEIPADVPLFAFSNPDTGRRPWSRWGVGFLRRSRWLSRLLRTERCDVVYDRTYLATLDTALACWSRGVPRISAAVADPRVQFEMYAKRLPALRRRYANWAYHTAAKVLANSAGLRQQMIEYWELPPEQVLVQPNGLDVERIEQQSREQTVPKNSGEVRLLTVGRIDEDKGHIDLLTALEELVHRRGHRELKWQILGVGPRRETLRQDVAAKGLTSHVEFVGAVSNPFPYYAAADVFVLPSRSEGLPNVLLEALAVGLPVISTDCPSGPREILEDGRYGCLIPVRDPAAFVEAIEEFLKQPEAWRQTAITGQASVRERFDIRHVVKTLEVLLEQAVVEKR